MNLDSPYFDPIRIFTNRKKKWRAPKRSLCAFDGCNEEGFYPAPYNTYPNQTKPLRYFCHKHIETFNKNYNFFEHMSEEELNSFIEGNIIGHRPTWIFGTRQKPHHNGTYQNGAYKSKRHQDQGWQNGGHQKDGGYKNKQHQDPFEFMTNECHFFSPPHTNHNANHKTNSLSSTKQISQGQKNALTILGLDERATPNDIKKQYKQKIKTYHPDKNGGSRHKERQLNQTIKAYQYLKTSGHC